MVTESHTYKYAMTVNEQLNPNSSVAGSSWNSMAYAVNGGDDFASARYERKGKKSFTYVNPLTVTAHDFRLDIPENAYITRVRFEVCARVDTSKIKVKAPNAYFMIYNGKGSVTQQTVTGKDGWYGSTYRNYADAYLSTSWKILTYTMEGKEWNKMKYPTKQLNNNIMGVDLHWNTPESMSVTSAYVQLRWVRIIVDYDLPDYHLIYTKGNTNSSENPLEVDVGDEYCVGVTFANHTDSNGGSQTIDVQLPFGAELKSYSATGSELYEVDALKGQYQWVCDGGARAINILKLCMVSKSYGMKTLSCTHNDVVYPYYVYPIAPLGTEYGAMRIVPATIKRNKESCFRFSANVNSNDSSITFAVKVDGRELTDWSKVSSEALAFYNNTNHGNNLVQWNLEQSSMINGVSIDEEHTDNNQITFNIPANTDVQIDWTGCFVPFFEGSNEITLTDGDTGSIERVQYRCLDAEIVEIHCDIDDTIWEDHRVLTVVETDGYVIRCAVRGTDKVMIEGGCTLSARMWENVAYIGCIPLSRSHYEPSHDFSNKILSESYKNKTYKGKEGVFEDDTDFKIRLPPKDWTTLQGLSKIDKPIPVNAVPSAFEGDVLNFRGWYEIGGIKGVTKTNPLYYDGQVDLDPLTHNINTRFSVEKGNSSNSYNISSAMVTLVETGDEFANRTYTNDEGEIVSTSEGYFDVTTDGVYIYDDDLEESLRTMITMDNAQYIKFVSSNYLKEQTRISLNWNAGKISENKENNIERIIYITDENHNPLFKYQYSDFEFDPDNEFYTCNVTGTVINNDSETTVIQKELVLAVDVESLNLVVDADGNIVQEDEPSVDSDDEEGVYAFNDYIYGSTLTFSLKNNVLSVIDTGFTGRSIVAENIELPISKYLYELDFHNNNSDVETTEVLHFFDFEVEEKRETSDLANNYGNMFVTSFPIPDKKILFTRQSEEGTIYYLADDGSNNFTYIQEPFYMYFCGVDLANHEGSSIFDLDNSYTTFYLQNGLVRLGFNRLNGELYLSKYDIYSKTYINVSYLKATNTDLSITHYSDDKITIKAGTTSYTMYRGHPYVVVSHPDEDLQIFNTINRVYTDKINDDANDYPVFFDLTNKDNLLPACVGSSNISIKCLDVNTEYVEESVNANNLTLTALSNQIYSNELSYYQVSGTVTNVTDNVPVDVVWNGAFGKYSSEILTDKSIPYCSRLWADNSIIRTGDTTNLYYSSVDFDGEPIGNTLVDFIELKPPFKTFALDGNDTYRTFRGASAPSFSDGVMTAQSTMVYGFENKENWVLECEYYYTGGGNLLLCPSDVTQIDRNWIQFYTQSLNQYQNGTKHTTSYTNIPNIQTNTWTPVRLEKKGSQMTVYMNEVKCVTFELNLTPSEWGIGVDHYADKFKNKIRNISIRENKVTSVTSDEQGVASLVVTGDGSGVDSYQARVGSLFTETYELVDATFYDKAITGQKNDNWNNYSNRLTVETDDTGTLITGNLSNNGYYIANKYNAFCFTDYICEFDLISVNGTVQWYHQNESGANWSLINFSIYYNEDANNHIKIIVKNGSCELYVDDIKRTTVSDTVTAPYEVAFRLNQGVSTPKSLKYKNFVIYPI